MENVREKGRVKWFNKFFVTQGQEVEFEIEQTEKGLSAVRVRIVPKAAGVAQ